MLCRARILVLSLVFWAGVACAEGAGGADPKGVASTLDDAVTDIYIIGGAGLMGAVLGLSTLSFVEEPKEHLKNIVAGGALGVIVGVAVVAWGQASKSKGMLVGVQPVPASPQSGLSAAKSYSGNRGFSSTALAGLGVSYRFTF